MDDRRFLDKLYEILASLEYNTERADLLQKVLRLYLIARDTSLDIVVESRKIRDEQRKQDREEHEKSKGVLTPDYWFQQDEILSGNIMQEHIPEYIQTKYDPFRKEFAKKFDLHVSAPFLFGFKLAEYLQFKKEIVGFRDDAYRFTSKEEEFDLGFVAMPPKGYIRKFGNVNTFNQTELIRILSGLVSPSEVESILDIMSNDIRSPLSEEPLRFVTKPLLRIDDETLVLLTPRYITRGLPSIYEQLFRQIKAFNDSKGEAFEALVQFDLKYLPFKSLSFNVIYGGSFDVDAIVEFERSIWFVEVSSHPPSLKSLQGDSKAIETDLNKATEKCIFQGKRCFEHQEKDPLRTFFQKRDKMKGILIVLDGVYPQLNPTTAIKFFEEKIPIYVLNWFDFRHLTSLPEVQRFEDFLFWRMKKPMPIVGFDEGEYWTFYFDRYTTDPKAREAFNRMQQGEHKILYTGARFNDKRYLEKIAALEDA